MTTKPFRQRNAQSVFMTPPPIHPRRVRRPKDLVAAVRLMNRDLPIGPEAHLLPTFRQIFRGRQQAVPQRLVRPHQPQPEFIQLLPDVFFLGLVGVALIAEAAEVEPDLLGGQVAAGRRG